ncbi:MULTISPECIES: glucuronate isomerase [Anaerotruncus]|uniref:glucuronate isomerase n=1 Tax=Anaerotruncus TaxID=244127 RepID=UPI000834211B|nr:MULTISPECIES: glucuronate isomerase [Anaerotruncus]RGX55644.1 glucuronate isomerase [Anaerotruncus sp. AF02-27]
MAKKFMDADFLLQNETAKYLYHNHAAKMPIIDYHCHINPAEIAEDRRFENIAQPWLLGDHYKWRQMRTNGTPEENVTGSGSDRDKFEAWAETLDKAIGNPLYHWTHLELQRYFDYDGVLGKATAQQVWDTCNKKLADPSMSVRGLIRKSNVKLICTTDDPIDDLRWHKKLAEDPDWEVKVLPAWRPDKAMNIEQAPYTGYIKTLSEVSGVAVSDFDSVCAALESRLDFFASMGCCASDHALDFAFYAPASKEELNRIVKDALAGKTLSAEDVLKYKTGILVFLARQYARRGWVMQLHYGAVRNTNSRMFEKLGADTGFDCMGNTLDAFALTRFFDALDATDELPKTVLYSLNGADNAMLGTVLGCFQGAGYHNKIQHGSAWWFNDTKAGMEQQLVSLANLSLLGNFIGMLTDSRSFLSYTRHEYFRRILCNLIGSWVEDGEYPDNRELLGKMVEDICYNNTKNFFGFDI